MKLPTAITLTVCAGVIAYFAGQWSQKSAAPGTEPAEAARPASQVRKLPSRAPRDPAEAARALGKYASCSKEFSADNAARLTPEERLELLANGAWAADYGNQEAMLCGLISVLTKDEIQEAANLLGSIQDQGSSQAPAVWQSLWQQWGRLDPEGCLKFFGPDAVSKSTVDARNVMTGWLEMNADAALAWAWKPGKSELEAAAAALAISRSVNGNLDQLESAILKLPGNEATSRACLEDYFDLATLKGADRTAATVYDELPPALRPAGWIVAAKRMGYGDSSVAKEWVTRHAHDPGRNYAGLSDLFNSLAYADPAATVVWASQLPYSPEIDRIHPAYHPLIGWRQRDPEAAAEWMKSQPADAKWLEQIPPMPGISR